MTKKQKMNKNDKTNLVSEEEMKEALSRAGYFLEQRIKRKLTQYGFLTSSNTSFNDPLTNKSREIDVEASLEVEILGSPKMNLYYVIIGECKNKFQPMTFIKDSAPPQYGRENNLLVTGSPTYFLDADNKTLPSIDDDDFNNSFGKDLWPASSNWCSFKYVEKIERWLATGDEDDFLSISSLVLAVQQRMLEYKTFTDYNSYGLFIFQPVLFLKNDFFLAEESTDKINLNTSSRTILNFEYSAINHENKLDRNMYPIHIVAESESEEYIKRTVTHINELKSSLLIKKDSFIREYERRKKE